MEHRIIKQSAVVGTNLSREEAHVETITRAVIASLGTAKAIAKTPQEISKITGGTLEESGFIRETLCDSYRQGIKNLEIPEA